MFTAHICMEETPREEEEEYERVRKCSEDFRGNEKLNEPRWIAGEK